MNLRINENCIGCGMCLGLSEIFDTNEDGYVFISADSDVEISDDEIIEAIESCPVNAIEKGE